MSSSVCHRPYSRWVLRDVALFFAAILAVCTTGPAALADERPVFPGQVELVTVDAVVVGQDGQPVRNLTREDFTVLEGGVPQEIAAFEAVALPSRADAAGAPAMPVSRRSLRVATNVAASAKRSTFLVIVDDVHLSTATLPQARKALEHFFDESTVTGDRAAVVSTATGTAWSGTLPGDRDDLLRFIGELEGQLGNANPELMTEYEAMRIAEYNDPEMIKRVMGRYYRRSQCSTINPCDAKIVGEARAVHGHAMSRRSQSLGVTERALRGLSRLRGRKTVILLSEGFVHDDRRVRSYDRVISAAQRTNAAIYFVDVRGVVGLTSFESAEAPGDAEPSNPKLPDGQFGVAARERFQDTVAAVYGSKYDRLKRELKIGVETMADDTGGFVIKGTNDLAGGLAAVASESRSHYLLGYHPTNQDRDGAFRKITLRVARDDVRVRARKGYLATEPGSEESRQARRDTEPDPLVTAFEAAAEVPLRLATYALEPAADSKTRVLAVTEIDVSDIHAEEKAGRRVGHLELRLEAIPRDGGETRFHSMSMDAELPADVSPSSHRAWRPLRLEFELPAGVYRVRASVRDISNGDLGIVAQRLSVPDPTSFRISTPILSDTLAAPSGDAEHSDGLAAVAHRRFLADSRRPLLCQFEVFGAEKAAATHSADVTVRLLVKDQQGRSVVATAPTPMTQAADGRLRQLIALPLGDMAAGEYELVLVVEDRVAGSRDEWQQAFEVATTQALAGREELGSAPPPARRAAAQPGA